MQIRDVDPAVRDRLKRRARDRGVSLNAYLKELLSRDASVPARAEVLERLSRRGDLVPEDAVPSTELLRDSRAERSRRLHDGPETP